MLHTVWRDPARYERDWQIVPGCYVTGDVATKDKVGYIAALGRYDDGLHPRQCDNDGLRFQAAYVPASRGKQS
jgi:hypothetical protein